MPTLPPVTYLLRDIDPHLWRKVKARAAKEGISVKAMLMAVLATYAAAKP